MNEDLEEQIRAVAFVLRGPSALPFDVRVGEHTDSRNVVIAVCTVTTNDGQFWCCGVLGTRRDALVGMLRTLDARVASRRLPPSVRTSESGTFVSGW